MPGTIKKISGPALLTASAADVYTPPNAAVDTIIRHIRVVNVTTLQATFTLYVGTTAGSTAGTEIAKDISVPAKDAKDIYFSPGLRLTSSQFLSGLANAVSTLTITVMGEYVAN